MGENCLLRAKINLDDVRRIIGFLACFLHFQTPPSCRIPRFFPPLFTTLSVVTKSGLACFRASLYGFRTATGYPFSVQDSGSIGNSGNTCLRIHFWETLFASSASFRPHASTASLSVSIIFASFSGLRPRCGFNPGFGRHSPHDLSLPSATAATEPLTRRLHLQRNKPVPSGSIPIMVR